MTRFITKIMTVVLLSWTLLSSVGHAAHAGDIVSNTADINYTIGGEVKTQPTNEVNLTIAQTPATIEFLTIDPDGSGERVEPTTHEGPGGTTPMPPATLPDGTVVPTPSDVDVSGTGRYGMRDLVLIRVTDIDQNTDATTQQIIDINITNPRTGEIETLHLMETGPNTGVFVGYIHTQPCPDDAGQSARLSVDNDHRDGAICVQGGDQIGAEYVDNGTLQHVKVQADAVIAEESFALLVTKQQSKDVASIGDYVQYTLTVENITQRMYKDVSIDDRLPDGVTYHPGSFKVEGAAVTPTLSPDGKTLTYVHPSLPKGATITLTYVAVIGAGVVDAKAINTAWAQAPGTTRSNIAKTTLAIREELWRSHGFIMGRVYEADTSCQNETNTSAKETAHPSSPVATVEPESHRRLGCGVEGVKLYMEDGRYVVTDKEGKYHFIDVDNGTHVVQVDEMSIEGRYTIEQCERNVRFAGKARSQFVEVHHGALNRADFCLKRIPGATGHTLLEVHIAKKGTDKVHVALKINGTMPLIDPEIFLSLSDGLDYVKGSSNSDAEPKRQDEILVVKMGSRREVELDLKITDVIIPDKELRAVLYYDTQLAKDQRSDVASVMFMTAKGKAAIVKITQNKDQVGGESVGGATPAGAGDYNWTKPTHQASMPQYSPESVDALGKKPGIIWPPKGWIPGIPSTRVAILYPKGAHVELSLNGHKVSPLNYEGLFRGENGMQVMHYKGVDLREGLNTFVAVITRGSKTIARSTRTVYVESRAPKRITLLPQYSYLMADGKHEPIIAIKMTGPSGHPLRGGMVGSFTTDPQHAPAVMSNGKGQYTIDSQGIAYVRLQPTALSGEAVLHFKLYGEKSETIRVRLRPYLRKWIVVGFAEGTVGYRTLSGHAEALKNKGVKKGLYVDGRLAFFAKGRIKGDWLLTLAYDSGRKKGDRRLFDAIDPGAYYSLYLDATHQGSEAPSTKKLYLKLEKDAFSILFGDYNTDIRAGEFDSYQRSYTGLKSTYHGANLTSVLFAAKTDKLHYRDELRADGTHGYYHLQHRPIVESSETVTLEVRDRHRSEIIVETRTLRRWSDYTIDYDTGALYFKKAIASSDAHFNPRTIVVQYDVEGDGESYYTYGGRISVRSDDQKFQAGATLIRQEHGDGADMLGGLDAELRLSPHARLEAEYAMTRSQHETNTSIGHAYRLSYDYADANNTLRAYWRYQDAAFGLGNLPSVLSATRKIGLDASRKLTEHWSTTASLYQDRRYDANGRYNDEYVFHPTLDYNDENWTASIGYRYAKNTATAATNQLTLKLTRTLMDRRLKLSLSHDQSLGSNEDKQYPTRTTLGMDYKIDENGSMFAQIERSDLSGRVSWQSRMGATYKPWEGGSITSSRLMGIDERGVMNIYDTLGLTHQFKVGKKWTWSLGYEKGLAETNTTTQSSFDVFRFTGKYEDANLTGNAMVEYRHAKGENKLNLGLGLYLRHSQEFASALGLGYHRSWHGSDWHRDIDAKFALAYRPNSMDWIVLDRLDLIDRYDRTATAVTRTSKMVNNLHAYWHPDEQWEVGLQYGLKYTRDTIDGTVYSGWTDLLGLDARYNINPTWAVGIQGSVLHAYGAHNVDYSGGAYIATTPWENAMLTFGYNVAGFEDEDFSQQNYRHRGPYVQIKVKFDQEDLKKVLEGVVK